MLYARRIDESKTGWMCRIAGQKKRWGKGRLLAHLVKILLHKHWKWLYSHNCVNINNTNLLLNFSFTQEHQGPSRQHQNLWWCNSGERNKWYGWGGEFLLTSHPHTQIRTIFIKKYTVSNNNTKHCTSTLHFCTDSKTTVFLETDVYFSNNLITHFRACAFSYCYLQGGHSDSGMGLSSDDLKKLKHLDSLVQPLSFMALA